MNNIKTDKGITLTALIITIIVLAALTSATISVVTKEDQGILTKTQGTVDKFYEVSEDKLTMINAYVDNLEDEAVGEDDGSSGNNGSSGNGDSSGSVDHNGDIIPVGAVYYTGDRFVADPNDPNVEGQPNHYYTTKLVEGEEFPETLMPGDIYIYGDYAYMYNFQGDTMPMECFFEGEVILTGGISGLNNSLNGWGVKYIGNSTVPGEIISNLRGKNIVSLSLAFTWKNITVAPNIPDTVKNLYMAFLGCESLTGAITINSTPTSYDNCLTMTNITEILGTCPDNIKSAILATKDY